MAMKKRWPYDEGGGGGGGGSTIVTEGEEQHEFLLAYTHSVSKSIKL